jgi:hypothetical protein
MSGHKRTTISVDVQQYRKMHTAALKAGRMDEESTKAVRALQDGTREMLVNITQNSQRSEAQFAGMIANLHQSVQAQEASQQQLIKEERLQLQSLLENSVSSLENDFIGLLTQQERHFTERLDLEERRRSVWENRMQQEMSLSRDRESWKVECTQQWLEAASSLVWFVQEHFPRDCSGHEKMENLVNDLEDAYENLENGFIDAALLQAQQTYRYVSRLRVQFEQQQLKYQYLYILAGQKIEELQVLLRHNATVKAIDEEGNACDYDVNLDWWTQGEWSILAEDLQQVESELRSPQDGNHPDTLESLIGETLPLFEQRLDEIIFQARLSVLQSQMRINIADLVIRAFKEQGYGFQQGQYEQDDFRSSYQASVINLEGSQVIIEVDPVPGQEFDQELHIHSLDQEQKTRHELRQRSLEVNRSLKKYGLHVGALTTQAPTPLPILNKRVHQDRTQLRW